MKINKYNNNWKFWEVTNSFALNWAPPEDAKTVDLPHDAMIERPQSEDCPAGANTGYRQGGVYNYSKTFFAEDQDRTYMLRIEGAYMNAFVYVNGQLAARRPYGYTGFYVSINEWLNYGRENELRIQVRSGAEPNSRWYPGTGLYRDVYLLEAGMQYIKPDSVRITTSSVPGNDTEDAKINVAAMIADRADSFSGSVDIIVTDPEGKEAAFLSAPLDSHPVTDHSATALQSGPMAGYPGLEDIMYYQVNADLTVKNPSLWDEDHPDLYRARIVLKDEKGNVIDTHSDTFGIRILSLSPEEGLKVNGKTVKLRGACIHHDSGLLGAKTYDEVHMRQIYKLKEAGFNAIRCAHNPAAPQLLRACDRLGMYVMDETFDIWTRNKSDYDYALYFGDWWEADVEAMVRNDYNHPSVILYSIGNEIPECCMPIGEKISKMLSEKIHSLDSTRYTLASVNGIFSVGDDLGKIVQDVAKDLESQGRSTGNVNDFMAFMHAYMSDMVQHPIVDAAISLPFAHTDIAGYNYMGSRYEMDGELHPDRVILGSETGIAEISTNWPLVQKLPYMIGDFCWTGWEYLGESGIGYTNYANSNNPFGNAYFPMQVSSTGCIDITGYRLPMSYYREIIFGLRKDPYIAVQDPAHYGEPLIKNPWIISDAVSGWSFKEYTDRPAIIEVYSDSEEVELYQNGELIGRKKVGEATPFMALFEVTCRPGTLKAISYTKGEMTGSCEIRSADDDLKLTVTKEPSFGAASEASDGSEIRFLDIAITDSKGIIASDTDAVLNLEIEGPARLLGFGSADPLPAYNYTEMITRTFRGRALLILKVPADKETTTSVIRITSDIGLSQQLEV